MPAIVSQVIPENPQDHDWEHIVPEEAQQVSNYLHNAHVLKRSPAVIPEQYTGREVVPLGLHTDGKFVWTFGFAYYFDNYKNHRWLPVEFLAHIRKRDYAVSPLSVAGAEYASKMLRAKLKHASDQSRTSSAR